MIVRCNNARSVMVLLGSIFLLVSFTVKGFIIPRFANLLSQYTATPTRDQSFLLNMACRRNNKLEKREKNKEYAKKFQSKATMSRKQLVIQQKRAVLVENEEKFGSVLFEHTTDDDYPPFTFDVM